MGSMPRNLLQRLANPIGVVTFENVGFVALHAGALAAVGRSAGHRREIASAPHGRHRAIDALDEFFVRQNSLPFGFE